MGHRHPVNQVIHDRQSRLDAGVTRFVGFFGGLKYITYQTLIVIGWVALNITGFVRHWDPYPFILLNLAFSTQASYAAPLILLAQNKQAERDRLKAEHDYQTNENALAEIRADKELTTEVRALAAEIHHLVVQGWLEPDPLAAVAADVKAARSSAEAAFAGVQALAAVATANPGPAAVAELERRAKVRKT